MIADLARTRDPSLVLVSTCPEPGGAAAYAANLVKGLTDAGCRVGVVTAREGSLWNALAPLHAVELFPGRFKKKFDSEGMRAVSRAAATVCPRWIVATNELDYWGAATVAAARRVRVALGLHHAWIKSSSMRGLPWLVDRYLVPSIFMQDWLVARGVHRSKVSVLPNCFDMSGLQQDPAGRVAARAALGVASDDVVVGYVGRIEANKGVLTLADALTAAMSTVQNIRALWVGFGRLEPDLDARIEQSAHRDRHTRRPWTVDVASQYQAVDVLAVPSTCQEAFGRVSVEAQASGVPVLGSDIGGIPETMIPGQTGALIPAGDVSAWSAAITDIARDTERRRRWGIAGREFARRHFDHSTVAVSAMSLFF